MKLIVQEKAEMLLHLGDMDYEEGDGEVWTRFLDTYLGTDFPVFQVAGNHDSMRRYHGNWHK